MTPQEIARLINDANKAKTIADEILALREQRLKYNSAITVEIKQGGQVIESVQAVDDISRIVVQRKRDINNEIEQKARQLKALMT